MSRKIAGALALITAIWLAPAHALGLGDVEVRSRLNQPFSAVIPVVDATAADTETLSVKLASAADFERSGVDRADYLTTLVFSLDPSGRVQVSSKQIEREPLLNFIVEARWRGGRVLREYTVLLDPPASAVAPATDESVPAPVKATAGAPKTAAPVRSTPPKPEPVVPTPAAVAPSAPTTSATSSADAASVPSRGGSTGTYGPIAPKETLWSIGVTVRPDANVTMDQVILALYQTNPEAFVGGIGGLQKGVTLRVPDAARMQAVDADTAKVRVARLRSGLPAEATAKATPVAPKAPEAAAAAKPAKKAAAPTVSNAPTNAHDLNGSLSTGTANEAAPAKPSAAEPVSALNSTSKPVAASPPAVSSSAESASAMKAAGPAAPAASAIAVAPPAVNPVAPAPSTTDTAGSANSSATSTSTSTAAAVPSPSAVTPSAVEPTTAASQPANESLFDGLLIPILVILAILLVISMLLWRRRLAAQSAPPPVALTPKSNLKVATAIGAAAGAAAAAAAIKRSAPLQTAVPSMFDDEPDALLDFSKGKPTRPVVASALGSAPEFAQTKPTSVQPVTMAVDPNDPIAGADFNVAYGLYDEAISLLKAGIAKEPGRLDLQTKLAETYAAAGKSIEFQEAAENLQGRVSDADWQKIALLGRKVSPDAAVFKKGGPVAMEPDLDMTLGAMARPTAAAAASAPAPRSTASIADMPQGPAAASPAATVASGLIDFDIEKELLAEPITAAAPAAPRSELDSLDLSEFDLGADAPNKVQDVNSIDFSLDELDLSDAGETDASSGFGDEVGTNLDLARAYVDMGDNEAARDLLNEVVAKGSAAQKNEASALLQRLA